MSLPIFSRQYIFNNVIATRKNLIFAKGSSFYIIYNTGSVQYSLTTSPENNRSSIRTFEEITRCFDKLSNTQQDAHIKRAMYNDKLIRKTGFSENFCKDLGYDEDTLENTIKAWLDMYDWAQEEIIKSKPNFW